MKAKDTKYLRWERDSHGCVNSVILTITNGLQTTMLRLTARTEIEMPIGDRYIKLKIVDKDFMHSGVPTNISKQILRYLTRVRQEADHDVMRIQFEAITPN